MLRLSRLFVYPRGMYIIDSPSPPQRTFVVTRPLFFIIRRTRVNVIFLSDATVKVVFFVLRVTVSDNSTDLLFSKLFFGELAFDSLRFRSIRVYDNC